ERTLDFVLNLFTANLSNSFIQAAQTENQLMHQLIMNITDSNGFIPYTEVNGVRIISGGWDNPNPANPSNSSTFEWFKRAVHVYDGPGGSGTGRTWGIISTNGRITFQENTLGIQEGIRDLKVVALRFLLSKYTR